MGDNAALLQYQEEHSDCSAERALLGFVNGTKNRFPFRFFRILCKRGARTNFLTVPSLQKGISEFVIRGYSEIDSPTSFIRAGFEIVSSLPAISGSKPAVELVSNSLEARFDQPFNPDSFFAAPKSTLESTILQLQLHNSLSKKPKAPKSNRFRSQEICRNYNAGKCKWGNKCYRKHSCSRCNGNHPVSDCTVQS